MRLRRVPRNSCILINTTLKLTKTKAGDIIIKMENKTEGLIIIIVMFFVTLSAFMPYFYNIQVEECNYVLNNNQYKQITNDEITDCYMFFQHPILNYWFPNIAMILISIMFLMALVYIMVET